MQICKSQTQHMISGACSDRPPLSKGTCFTPRGGFDGGRICQGDKSPSMPFRYRTETWGLGRRLGRCWETAERASQRFMIDLLEQIFITLQRGQSDSATTGAPPHAVGLKRCRGIGLCRKCLPASSVVTMTVAGKILRCSGRYPRPLASP